MSPQQVPPAAPDQPTPNSLPPAYPEALPTHPPAASTVPEIPQSPQPPTASPQPSLESQPIPPQPVQIDTSQLFRSAAPPNEAIQNVPTPSNTPPLFAPDALPADVPHTPEPQHKKRVLLSIALVAVSLILAGSAFVLLRPKGGTHSSQSDSTDVEISEGVETGAFLSTASESDKSDVVKESPATTSSKNDDSTTAKPDNSPSSSGTANTSNTPTPKPAPTKPTPSTVSGLKCVLADAKFKDQVTDPSLGQAAKSILAARGGATSQLLSWVPTAYRNEASGKTVPEIDASFKKYQPKNCKIEFAHSVPKTTFSGRAIVMIATFDQTTATGKHFAHINVAYVNNAWRTYGMSEINKAQ